MNKEKKRQRKMRQRIDYRTGGRVSYQEGREVFDEQQRKELEESQLKFAQPRDGGVSQDMSTA